MNRYLLLFVFILITQRATGQDSAAIRHVKNPYKYWAVKLPIFNMIDINSPNFIVGIERRFDKHNAVQLLAGPSIDDPANKNNGGPNQIFNGFRVRAEYRRYFKVRPYHAFYFAGEYFYTKYNSSVESTFTDTFTSVDYTEKYRIFKTNAGVNVKIGFHKSFQYRKGFMKHLMFDAYAGMGGKHRVVTQTGRSNPLDIPYHSNHPNKGNTSYAEGDESAFSMTMNFSLGYIFR